MVKANEAPALYAIEAAQAGTARTKKASAGGSSVSDDDRTLVEQRIAEAGLRPYQAMVVRNVYEAENVTAALTFIERLKEVL